MEEKYEQAGDMYTSLKFLEGSERCYWKGSVWYKLQSLYGKHQPSKLLNLRQSIVRNATGLIHHYYFPAHIKDELHKILRYLGLELFEQFQTDFSMFENLDDIAKEIDIDRDKLIVLLGYLDVPLSFEGDNDQLVMIPRKGPSVVETVDDELTEKKYIKNILDYLSERDVRSARIIKMRFGLNNRPRMSLAETGRKLGVTRERVRQIELQEMRRLRQKTRAEVDFLPQEMLLRYQKRQNAANM